MKKGLQLFSDEYITQSKKVTPEQAMEFLEHMSEIINHKDSKRKLISLRVPENILENFKTKATLEGKKYQSLIVELMREHLINAK